MEIASVLDKRMRFWKLVEFMVEEDEENSINISIGIFSSTLNKGIGIHIELVNTLFDDEDIQKGLMKEYVDFLMGEIQELETREGTKTFVLVMRFMAEIQQNDAIEGAAYSAGILIGYDGYSWVFFSNGVETKIEDVIARHLENMSLPNKSSRLAHEIDFVKALSMEKFIRELQNAQELQNFKDHIL